jgi:hypothetical protein
MAIRSNDNEMAIRSNDNEMAIRSNDNDGYLKRMRWLFNRLMMCIVYL